MSNLRNICKAIFQVAGFGSLFKQSTRVMPKELLPFVFNPLFQYVVEKAVAAVVDTLMFVAFVADRKKCGIDDHFSLNSDLKSIVRAKGKDTRQTWFAILF